MLNCVTETLCNKVQYYIFVRQMDILDSWKEANKYRWRSHLTRAGAP